MYSNQSILRYIKYLDNDPLNNSHLDVTPDMIEGQIIFKHFNNNLIINESRVLLLLNFCKGNYSKNNTTYGENIYKLEVLCPHQNWDLDGLSQTRCNQIIHELAQIIDNQDISKLGRCIITERMDGSLSDTYGIAKIYISITDLNI